MPVTPHQGILDRKESEKLINEHFSDQVKLLREMVNYGTNLIVRVYESSKHELADAILCGVLLKQIVTMVDAVETLISSGAIHAAQLPARAAFEASLYLEWMLFSDLENKARYYYVSNLRQERTWALRCSKGSPEHQSFSEVTASLGIDYLSDEPSLVTDSVKNLENINSILAQPEFSQIDQELERIKTKRKRGEPNWYVPLGIRSIRDMAKQLQRLPEYQLFYSKGSEVTHSAAYKDHLHIGSEQLKFKPIRSLEGVDILLSFTYSITIGCYDMTLKYYRPKEVLRFYKHYMQEWRDPFLNIKKVKMSSS
ncbi:MAG: DUF5677 domain-containing protein [Mariprofundaceae bacterium]|nr:DUF5677 domain-containing protein [Mariprofundaceae bacterium]